MAQHVTAALRDYLIEHIDGPVAIVRNNAACLRPPVDLARREHAVRAAAVQRGWIKMVRRGSLMPTHTELTPDGREALAAALGSWADAIVRARGGEGWFADSAFAEAMSRALRVKEPA